MAKKEEAKEKKEEGKEAAEAAPKPKSKKKLFMIVGAVAFLGIAAGVPLMMLGGAKEGDGKEAKHEEHHEKELETVAIDTFIVNLSETGAFLKVKMLLEFDAAVIHKAEEELAKQGKSVAAHGGEKEGKGEAGLSGYMKTREPMMRDSVIRILSSKRAVEVLSLDGKEKLKDELIEAINESMALEEGPVQGIYFAEFIIQ